MLAVLLLPLASARTQIAGYLSTLIYVYVLLIILYIVIQLLFSVGRTVVGQSETYGYLGLYWTWGGHADTAARPVAWSRTSAAPAGALPQAIP